MCRTYEESKRGSCTPSLEASPAMTSVRGRSFNLPQSRLALQKQSVLLKSQAPGALNTSVLNMADDGTKKARTFRKFTYRGVDLDQLLDMKTDELVDLFPARARRK